MIGSTAGQRVWIKEDWLTGRLYLNLTDTSELADDLAKAVELAARTLSPGERWA
ncbi:MAG: hypothetical protein ACE5JX_17645 [Acidobacteriota bacterium]